MRRFFLFASYMSFILAAHFEKTSVLWTSLGPPRSFWDGIWKESSIGLHRTRNFQSVTAPSDDPRLLGEGTSCRERSLSSEQDGRALHLCSTPATWICIRITGDICPDRRVVWNLGQLGCRTPSDHTLHNWARQIWSSGVPGPRKDLAKSRLDWSGWYLRIPLRLSWLLEHLRC